MTCISKAVYAAVACCCLTGTISAQNIALKMNNVTVKQAMEELEKKSGYSFVFSSQDVDTHLCIRRKRRRAYRRSADFERTKRDVRNPRKEYRSTENHATKSSDWEAEDRDWYDC